MTCSPYQHVPGTPSLNKSFTFKLTEFHRATPEQSVPRTPCRTFSQFFSSRTSLLTSCCTPIARVPHHAQATPLNSIPASASSYRGFEECFRRRIGSQEISSAISLSKPRIEDKTSNTQNKKKQTLLDDFQIVPDIAWVEGGYKPESVYKAKYLDEDSKENLITEEKRTMCLDEDIWG